MPCWGLLMEGKHTGSVSYLYGGGGHGARTLVMKILGSFRCICPVAKGGKLEADTRDTFLAPAAGDRGGE